MKRNISRIATLANLPFTDEEIKKLEPQLEETLSYVDQLNEIDTTNIEPTSQVTGLENILREDVTKESLTQEEALSNAKIQYNGLFQVKGIFDSE